MSFFLNYIGNADQIGGEITLINGTDVFVPSLQGTNYVPNTGLSTTNNRAFEWSLAEPYPGVNLSNQNNINPTITFDTQVYDRLLILLRCNIKGQPLNFVEFKLSTNLITRASASYRSTISNVSYPSINVRNIGIILDSSEINEAGTIDNISSSLILNWSRPDQNYTNVTEYLVEELVNNQYYLPISLTKNTSIIVSPIEKTYYISARFNSNISKSGREQITVNNDNIYAKTYAKFNYNSITSKTKFDNASSPPIFFTKNTLKSYQENASLEYRSTTSNKTSLISYNEPSIFFTVNTSLPNQQSNLNLEYYSNSNYKTTVISNPGTPLFWSENTQIST